MLKIRNKKTRTRCEICSKLTIKTPEQHRCSCSGIFSCQLKHISHVIVQHVIVITISHIYNTLFHMLSLLLTLSR